MKHSFLAHRFQLIVAISNPPRKQDAPKPLNFKPSTLPGFRGSQPRRFAIELSPININTVHNKQNVDFVSDQSEYERNRLSSILRNVMRIIQEDTAAISSLRTLAAAQFEEYILVVDDLVRQLNAAEKEKKTLSQMLRLAVQQKLTVTERLHKMKM